MYGQLFIYVCLEQFAFLTFFSVFLSSPFCARRYPDTLQASLLLVLLLLALVLLVAIWAVNGSSELMHFLLPFAFLFPVCLGAAFLSLT